jgi:hypothetical protein
MDNKKPDDAKPRKGKMRSYTVAALLGIFVVAVVLAVVGRFLPGRLSDRLKTALSGVRGKRS